MDGQAWPLPEILRPLFHNYAPDSIDPTRDAEWIILTVLLYGDLEHWKWLFSTYGWERVKAVVERDLGGHRVLPHTVANFWSVVFWNRALDPPSPRSRWVPTRLVPGV
ncbi:MAG: hypothetical protein QJR08_06145 [Bacillota bacterium]|nr:hypothetical protein [Bacillota bacterium]